MVDGIRTVQHSVQDLEARGSEFSARFLINEVTVPIHCRFLTAGVSPRNKPSSFRHPLPPFSRLFLFRSGSARIELASGTRRLGAHRMYLLPSHQPFLVTYSRSTLYYFHLHIFDIAGDSIFRRTTGVPELVDRAVSDAIIAAKDKGDVFSLQSLVFHSVLRFTEAMRDELAENARRSLRFKELIQYMRTVPTAALSIDQLAARQHTSRSALSKGFRRTMGVSLKEFLIRICVERAQEMLTYTDKTVLEIADELGYGQACYFHRVFKRVTGRTPKEYRSLKD